MSSEESKIIVDRPSGRLQDRFRAYTIWIDDVETAKLGSGETIDIVVAPGSHALEARIDGMKSHKEQLEIALGETRNYSVRPSRQGGALRALFSSSEEWLTLEPKDDH